MKKHGFTLLEFLISVSLTIILLTMGLPSLASLITTSDS
ncbi:MAG: pilus assembly FimT family protein, partial [Aeromonas sobria]